VVITTTDECVDGDDAIAPRTVLDYDRLAPPRGESIGEQPRADINSGARA
jgi:hypothetical protein